MSIIVTKQSITLLLLSSILSSGVTYYFVKENNKVVGTPSTVAATPSKNENSANVICNYKIKRMGGFELISPLEYAEPECETVKYQGLKKQIISVAEAYKSAGTARNIAVYFRDFEKADWIGINSDDSFHPGSLMKLPMLITYLRMNEKKPGFIGQKVNYSHKPAGMPNQTFNSKQIEVGKSYSLKELLEYMIIYSDNQATMLLHEFLDLEEYKHTYSDIGLSIPNIQDRNYTITPKEYSTFLKVLYNGSYLTFEDSEYAMELLKKAEYKDGFVKGFPKETTIVHKFGEWGDGISQHELHESGIIYYNGKAYLLTIMTSGNDVTKLPQIIADIATQITNGLNASASKTNHTSHTELANL